MTTARNRAAQTALALVLGLATAAAAATAARAQDQGSADAAATETPAAADTLETYDAAAVLATVGDTDITLGDLITARQELPADIQEQPDSVLFAGLLNQLITRELLAQAGADAGVDNDPAVQAEIRDVIGRAFYEQTLEAARADISDDAAQARYQDMIGQLEQTEEVRARHILVESEEAAKAIKAELDGGADFATLAEEKSTGPSSSRGGDLGFFTFEQMVPAFSEAAFALEAGQVSEPVQSRFGWHVIKVEERRTQAPPPFEAVKERLIEGMAREAAQEKLQPLRTERVTEAERLPPAAAIREDALVEGR